MRRLLPALLLLLAGCGSPALWYAPAPADRDLIAGRTWVITGASSGIGRGVAERAGALGANVVLAARRAEALEEVARVIRASGGEALVVPTDVSDPAQVEALAEAAERRFGRIDLWMNNAGVVAIGPFEAIAPAQHARIVAVNLTGTMLGSHAALSRFRAQGFGALVNIASVEGRIPLAYHASYAATKHGVVGLDGALREEVRLAGLSGHVRIVTVLPWAVDTPIWENAANASGRRPVGPWADDARQVADAITWAAIRWPSGEFPVGAKAGLALAGAQVAPGLSRRVAADLMQRLQMQEAPPAPNRPGNLFAPSPAPPTVAGGGTGR